MIYRVKHLTEYLYGETVSTSHHELHLLPRTAPGQTIHAETLRVEPDAAVRRDRFDWFGNRCTHLAIHERHNRLAVTSHLDIEVAGAPPPVDTAGWEETRDAVRAAADPDTRAVTEFVLASARVTPSSAAREFAAPSFPRGRPLVEAARDLMHRIHVEFTYDPEATDVSTSVDEVLQHKRGVCQDFAHVQIACLRSLGLPARYVSGYLVTRPDGEPQLVGADASHAWLSVRLPSGGWLELDPTNDVVPSTRHIVVAYGRDFGDVTPMRGVILGGGRHQLRVAVDVQSIGAAAGLPGSSERGPLADGDPDRI
jgi:transglutaminase-like putative cysteine protease